MSSNPTHGKVYLIQRYVIKNVSDFSPGIQISSTNKSDHHDITEIMLKVALNTITLTPNDDCHTGSGQAAKCIFNLNWENLPVPSQESEWPCVLCKGNPFCLCFYDFSIGFWHRSSSMVFYFFHFTIFLCIDTDISNNKGPLWSYGSWIYNYLCNQCRSWRGVLDTTLCDKVCQWLVIDQWFFPGTQVFSINKTDCHDITEILLKVALNTINKQTKKPTTQPNTQSLTICSCSNVIHTNFLNIATVSAIPGISVLTSHSTP